MKPTIPFSYERASAKLQWMADDLYAVRNLWSQTRGLGHARGIMEKIIKYADDHGLDLFLIAQQYGSVNHPSMNNKELEAFYMKFGFKRAESSNGLIKMIRLTSRDLHGP